MYIYKLYQSKNKCDEDKALILDLINNEKFRLKMVKHLLEKNRYFIFKYDEKEFIFYLTLKQNRYKNKFIIDWI